MGNPDFEKGALGGNPTSYEAIRLASSVFGNAVYVEYLDRAREREYYRIDGDPAERVNVYRQLSASTRAQLHAIVRALSSCHGASRCWAAGQPR